MSGWELVRQWLKDSRWHSEILPADGARGEHELDQLEITTRSPLGGIVRHSAGILIDHGWLRVLGAGGHERLQHGVNEWFERTGALIVAHDAGGGFFSWEREAGVLYHDPATGRAESLDGRGYSDWLHAMLEGDLNLFYEGRPGDWRQQVVTLSADEGLRDGRPTVMFALWEELHSRG